MGDAPLKAQVRKAGVTYAQLGAGTSLHAGSRLAVEIDLYNADQRRALTVHAPQLVVRDALGGPEIIGAPVATGDGGLPPVITVSDATVATTPITLRPGEGRTVWIAYAGFPADGPHDPVLAVVRLQADTGPPLELVIANPVPGGPRWHAEQNRITVASTIGGALSTFQTGSRSGDSDIALAPISVGILASWGRLFWGVDYRFQFLYREAVAGGPIGRGGRADVSIGFLPWRFPLGLYAQFGGTFLDEVPPAAYRQLDGSEGSSLFIPHAGAGIVYNVGAPIRTSGPLPIERPMSAMRRLQLRIGYTQWFRLGSSAGAGGLEMSLVAVYWP
jgi:hypothetical protein